MTDKAEIKAAFSKAASLHSELTGLDPNMVKALAASLVDVPGVASIRGGRIVPYGIPKVDSLGIRGSLEPGEVAKLLDTLRHPGVAGVSVFPFGIVAPDLFRVEVMMKPVAGGGK